MLLTSGWEAGGGEFFAVLQGVWIALNLKSPEIDTKRRDLGRGAQLVPLCFQRHQLFPAHLFSFLGSLCDYANDVLSCLWVKARVLCIWGEEQVVVDLPTDSGKAGVDSSLRHELLVFQSPSLCLTGGLQFNLQASWGIRSPCWCSAFCVFGGATSASWGEWRIWLEGK